MEKIGIIVDGPGDFHSLKTRYPNRFKVLKTGGPRGHCVTIEQIISNARKQISMLIQFKCTKVIIMTDFECRTCKYEEFLDNLYNELIKYSFPINISFSVPNQMIENWYLADIVSCSKNKKFIKSGLKQKKYEGKHGKKELKKLLIPNFKYNEINHGPQLFSVIDDQVATKNSKSYNLFLSLINER